MLFKLADVKNKFVFEIDPHIFGADYLTETERECWMLFYSDKHTMDKRKEALRNRK